MSRYFNICECDNLVSFLDVRESVERDPAFSPLPHLRHVLLQMLQRLDRTYGLAIFRSLNDPRTFVYLCPIRAPEHSDPHALFHLDDTVPDFAPRNLDYFFTFQLDIEDLLTGRLASHARLIYCRKQLDHLSADSLDQAVDHRIDVQGHVQRAGETLRRARRGHRERNDRRYPGSADLADEG
jgi:hypothetical protein